MVDAPADRAWGYVHRMLDRGNRMGVLSHAKLGLRQQVRCDSVPGREASRRLPVRCRVMHRTFLGSIFRTLCVMVLLALGGPALSHADTGDELTVSLLTLSPGQHPFARFGHIEIWIHNAAAPVDDALMRDPVYNFGNFTFNDPALIPKFLLGRFVYWLGKEPITQRMQYARRLGRTLHAQELYLTAAEKRALRDTLEENLREENRYYKYDYYRDNCATRVRDVIDRILHGKLRAVAQGPAAMTWRAHTLRLTAEDPLLSLALTGVLAGFTDRPITQWQEMFLAPYIQMAVRRVQVPGPDGAPRSLVASERSLVESPQPVVVRTEAPGWLLQLLTIGVLAGALFFAVARAAAQSGVARMGLAILLVVCTLLSAGGVFLIFVWFLTDHEACHRNENILQLMPLGVVLLGLCTRAARLDRIALARVRTLLACAAVSALFGAVWKVLPWMRQDNVWIIALCAPTWIGGALGLSVLERSMAVGQSMGSRSDEADRR